MKRLRLIDGVPELRVRKVKESGIKVAHLVVQCGCCANKIEIYPSGLGDQPGLLEIGGVEGSIRNWRAILLPLLKLGSLRRGK